MSMRVLGKESCHFLMSQGKILGRTSSELFGRAIETWLHIVLVLHDECHCRLVARTIFPRTYGPCVGSPLEMHQGALIVTHLALNIRLLTEIM